MAQSAAAAPVTGVQSYPFFPQAGNPWQDIVFVNFIDLGDGVTPLDFDCTKYSYATHTGIDSIIRVHANGAMMLERTFFRAPSMATIRDRPAMPILAAA